VVCSCLGALPESVVPGLCVNYVMALFYFLLVSLLAFVYQDCDDDDNNPNPGSGENGQIKKMVSALLVAERVSATIR
jgi:hypothetical protein